MNPFNSLFLVGLYLLSTVQCKPEFSLIDRFDRSRFNKPGFRRSFWRGEEILGVGMSLKMNGVLYETISSDPIELSGKAFMMIYSSTEAKTWHLGIRIKTGRNLKNLHELDFNLSRGKKETVIVNFSEFECVDGPKAAQIVIRADKILVRKIYIIDEVEHAMPHQLALFPIVADVPGLNKSGLLIDNFRYWRQPHNAMKGDRIIKASKHQIQLVANLRTKKELLIEYFPVGYESYNIQDSEICITYSSSKKNRKGVISNPVGSVHRLDNVWQRNKNFFGMALRKGRNISVCIPITRFIKSEPGFMFDSYHGIVIRGPLKIHQIVLVSPVMMVNQPTSSQVGNQAYAQSPLECNNQAQEKYFSKIDNRGQDQYYSNNPIPDTSPCTSVLDNLPNNYMGKHIRFRKALSEIFIHDTCDLNLLCTNVLQGSYEVMQLDSFRMNIDVNILDWIESEYAQTKELYFDLLKFEILAPETELFEQTSSSLYRIIPRPDVSPKLLNMYRFVGRALGMGIIHSELKLVKNFPMLVNFVPMVYRSMLGKPIQLADMEHINPSLLSEIKTKFSLINSARPDPITMSVSYIHPDLLTTVVEDLVPNGEKIVVDFSNMTLYVAHLIQWHVQRLVGAQSEALHAGLCDVIPQHILSEFNELELEHFFWPRI